MIDMIKGDPTGGNRENGVGGQAVSAVTLLVLYDEHEHEREHDQE